MKCLLLLVNYRNIKKRILTSATEAVEIPGFIGLNEPVRLNYLSGELQKRWQYKY